MTDTQIEYGDSVNGTAFPRDLEGNQLKQFMEREAVCAVAQHIFEYILFIFILHSNIIVHYNSISCTYTF